MKIKYVIISLMLSIGLSACKKDKTETDLPQEITTVIDELHASFDTLNNSIQSATQYFAVAGVDTAIMRTRLTELLNQATFTKEFSFVNPQGIMQIVEPPEFHYIQGADISTQAHIVKMFETKQPVLSNMFYAVEGFYAASDIHPVVKETQVLGGIDALFTPADILGRVILPLIQYQAFEIWVMDNNGMVLYDQDSAEIGLNVLTDPVYAGYPELIKAAQKIATQKSGETMYSFYQTGTSTVVTKRTFWGTFSLYGTEWKIVWVKPE
ncbi:MAG: cache domain-containing protein [Bacteroidales bacterium]